MKKDTITITRAEYEQLNKAARLVDALKARIAELVEDCVALERRIGDVQADRDEWRHCNAMLQDENAALKARVAELEAKNDTIKDTYFKLYDYALELEDREEHLENLLKHAREDVAELEADVNTLQVKIAAREEYIEAQEATIRFLKRACGWNN